MIAGGDLKEVESFIRSLEAEFKITSGPIDTDVGMEVEERTDGIFIHQHTYTKKILERFKMNESNPVPTPSDNSCIILHR
jgi:hypothetical protein